jgi:signal transduction histidine kinase
LIGRDVELALELRSQIDLVYADPAQIQRALANLVKNAAEAMPRGGRLTIATSNDTVRDEDLAEDPNAKPGKYVRLSVTDTGEGLSDEAMAHLFEPFFTTKPPGKGTGLGLSTVYGIVTQSDGQIVVRGERGKGTTFEILLPASASVIQ